jgi:hypothetical protein
VKLPLHVEPTIAQRFSDRTPALLCEATRPIHAQLRAQTMLRRQVHRCPGHSITGSLAATVRGQYRQQPFNPAWVERPVIVDESSTRPIAEIHSADLASMELTAPDRAQLNPQVERRNAEEVERLRPHPPQDQTSFEFLRASSAAARTAAQGLDARDQRVQDLHGAPLSS